MTGPLSTPSATADLFGGLDVRSPTGDRPAERVDIGWTAWRHTPINSRWQRLRLWLAIWRHLGRARYFVQIDDQYRLATSVRVRRRADGSDLDIRLLQAGNTWHALWLRLRHGRTACEQLTGRDVRIARYPQTQENPDLPRLPASAAGPTGCPEALLDRKHPCQLPLHLRSSR